MILSFESRPFLQLFIVDYFFLWEWPTFHFHRRTGEAITFLLCWHSAIPLPLEEQRDSIITACFIPRELVLPLSPSIYIVLERLINSRDYALKTVLDS